MASVVNRITELIILMCVQSSVVIFYWIKYIGNVQKLHIYALSFQNVAVPTGPQTVLHFHGITNVAIMYIHAYTMDFMQLEII